MSKWLGCIHNNNLSPESCVGVLFLPSHFPAEGRGWHFHICYVPYNTCVVLLTVMTKGNSKWLCHKASVHPYSIVCYCKLVHPFWTNKWINRSFRATKNTLVPAKSGVLSCVMLLMRSDAEIQEQCLLSTKWHTVRCVGVHSYWVSGCQTWLCHFVIRIQMCGHGWLNLRMGL